MIDVHAPEHRLDGVRDFVIHLLTITVGLLIALGLEACVEAMHHRHQRHEAEANIRQELQHNRERLVAAIPIAQKQRASLQEGIGFLRAAAAGSAPHGNLSLDFTYGTLDDGAWRTATQTGVLAYMEFEEVERFSDTYKEQAMLEAAEDKALQDYLEFTPLLGDTKDLSPEVAKQTLPTAQRALGHFSGVFAIGKGTLDSYNKALD